MKKIVSLLICAAMLLVVLPLMPQKASAASVSTLDIRLREPVASYNPDFSQNLSNSSVLVWDLDWTENSPGFGAALKSTDEFRAGLAYKVEIWLRCISGTNFGRDVYGALTTSFTMNGKPVTSAEVKHRDQYGNIDEVIITQEFGPLSGMTISQAQVTGIPTPVAGSMPIYSFTLGSVNAYGYYHTQPIVWWDENTGKAIDSGDTFIAGHKYKLEIWLSANRESGYTFQLDSRGEPDVNVTLNSWAADSVITAYEQDPREVITVYYTFPACQAPHTCAPKLVPQKDPTCLMYGFKAYYECSCGNCFEDAAGKKPITDMDGYGILPALGHAEGSWSYNGTHHYKKCSRCKEVIPGTNAPHSGGNATCVEAAACEVCQYVYKNSNENHVPDTKWTACGELYHAHLCRLCGAHCDTAAHVPGPAATESQPQKCKDCGFILEPAKNHTHNLTKVEAKEPTCTQPGNKEHYTCDGCADVFADSAGKTVITDAILAPLGHKISESWSYDENFHWRICETCQIKLEETYMLHEGQEQCDTCGYVPGLVTEPVPEETTQPATENTTEPAEEDKTTDDDKDQGIDWVVLLVVGISALVVAACVTVTVIVLSKNKKKGE